MKGMDWEEVGFRVGAFSSILLLELFFGSLPLAMQRCFTNTELRDRLLSLANVFAGGLFLASGFGASFFEGGQPPRPPSSSHSFLLLVMAMLVTTMMTMVEWKYISFFIFHFIF